MGTTSSREAFLENFKLLCDLDPLSIDDSVWLHLLKNTCSMEELQSAVSYQEILEIKRFCPLHLKLLLNQASTFLKRMSKGELHLGLEACEMSLRVIARLTPVILSEDDSWMWTDDSLALSLIEALTDMTFAFGLTSQVASMISPYGRT